MHRGGGISARCVWEVDPVSQGQVRKPRRGKSSERGTAEAHGARARSNQEPSASATRRGGKKDKNQPLVPINAVAVRGRLRPERGGRHSKGYDMRVESRRV